MKSPVVLPSGGPVSRAAGVVGLAALLVALLGWALASPVGATPDEDYHLASIWCGQGERDGLCEAGDGETSREVQQRLLSSPCYAFEPAESAACQGPVMTEDTELVDSERGNFVGAYPPVFYFVMSIFVGDEVADSVLVMRAVNALLVVLLVAAVWLASPPGLRGGLVGGAVVTAVPLGMFLLPSVNPSSWALLSAMTLPVAVLGYITTADRRRRWVLGVLAAVALGVGAGARADAALYGALAIGLAGIATLRPGWAHVRRLVYPALLGVVAILLFFSAGQSESVSAGGGPTSMSLPAFVRLMGDVPSLWTGALGSWGLGWLDTYMPAVVWVAAWSVLVGTVFAALAGADLRRLAALLVGGVAVWVVPTYMQYLSGYPVGAAIQPRYVLPIIVVLAVVALSRTQGPAVRWSGGQWALVVLALGVAHAVALHTNVRRYVTGADVVDPDLDAGAEWWWPGLPLGPTALWVVASAAFVVAVGLLTLSLVGPRDAAFPEVRPTPADPGHDVPEVERTDAAGVPPEPSTVQRAH
ncbi:DUF2142 domain-containing protein [Cellulomonas sp. JZ18]|uniref:DUF2142 domain-containing protein n=1 Tax=Cellulomonas sp. JZ18 TaxID=2654191 RepID=UPI0012D40EF9|nr:DUF2142 domain-containing protein [Cellulomonas sp. JZ18]QGQ18886.1 DUF2142 domain-containing protein [Cellulomonas sp. JZ18]